MRRWLIWTPVLIVALAWPRVAAQARPEWDDPAVIRVGALPARATLTSYPDAPLALASESSPWVRSLNGEWKYHWSESPSTRPASFFAPEFNDSGWGTIGVPGNVELSGHGIPIYVNAGYAFTYSRQDPRPPADTNPVSSYRRTFDLPEDWTGRRTRLRFDGVDSAFYV